MFLRQNSFYFTYLNTIISVLGIYSDILRRKGGLGINIFSLHDDGEQHGTNSNYHCSERKLPYFINASSCYTLTAQAQSTSTIQRSKNCLIFITHSWLFSRLGSFHHPSQNSHNLWNLESRCHDKVSTFNENWNDGYAKTVEARVEKTLNVSNS